jgi:hypothetical protein
MVRRNAFERWESKLSDSEITPHAFWPLAKFVMRRDKPKAPTGVDSPSGLIFLPLEKSHHYCVWKTNSHHTICVRKVMNG